jgi:uncharacterized protein (TIGR00375 family)
MDVQSLIQYGTQKGLRVIGTGDFTHPQWLKELEDQLEEHFNTSLFKPKENLTENILFMLTAEVCTIFKYEEKSRRIHHLLFTPNFDSAKQVSEKLAKFGNLKSDGRPILRLSPPELVEEVKETSKRNVIIPAHIWTPWFSLFGSKNGFERIEDCYKDMTKHIFALETGLSSDPPMNWRLSALDKYTLISNSDSHSPYPYRIGREANVFVLKKTSYREIIDSIRLKDKNRFKFTIETHPAYGKYHWTGHRKCNIMMSPQDAKRLQGICPSCGRKMTRGVDERVEELSDRYQGYKPESAIEYKHLMPLHEIIARSLGIQQIYSPSVWRVYEQLIGRFDDEYSVLLEASKDEIALVSNDELATAIITLRENKFAVIPGYDGVYGRLIFSEDNVREVSTNRKFGLEKFM